MIGSLRFTMVIASLGLVACHRSESKKESDRSTNETRAASDCDANKISPSDGWKIIKIGRFDATAIIAAKAAAEAGELNLPELKSKYCSYERLAENAVDRCFLFLRNPPTPGGDIKVCIAPDGHVIDTYLGE